MQIYQSQYARIIVVADNKDLEWATGAAMFSRSVDGIETIMQKISADKAGEFYEKYYANYGHESIADLVHVKMFIHGISPEMACLIEHHSLFNGQESSTRYIDFANTGCAYGFNLDHHAYCITEYSAAFAKIRDNLADKHKPNNGVASRAIDARAFDMARGLLPVSFKTNVSWFGHLNGMLKHIKYMLDLCPEHEATIMEIYNALKNSFKSGVIPPLEKIRYVSPWTGSDDGFLFLKGKIDFGSWRDIHRHRVGSHSWPNFHNLSSYPINAWYAQCYDAHKVTWDKGYMDIARLGNNLKFVYAIPTQEQCEYFFKLRTSVKVHPTVRNLLHHVYSKHMLDSVGIPVNLTPDPGPFGYFEIRGNDTFIIDSNEQRSVAE